MTPEQQLDILMTLATDIGYEIRTENANVIPMQSVRAITMADDLSALERVRILSKTLANDPELAMYEIEASQETALRMGRAA